MDLTVVFGKTENYGFVSRHPRGQVGIGTLIIFIAMVLVATIAGGVLIETAGLLQSQAEETGEESINQVVNRIQVYSSVGVVGEGSDALDPDNVVVADEEVQDAGDVVTGEIINENDGLEAVANVVTDDGENVVDRANIVTDASSASVTGENGDSVVSMGGLVKTQNNNSAVSRDGDNIITFDDEGNKVNVETNFDSVGDVVADDFEEPKQGETPDGIQRLKLTVGTGPGSGPVDLNETTIRYFGPDGVVNIVSNSTGATERPTFEVRKVQGDTDNNVLSDRGDRVVVVVNLLQPNGNLEPLTGGEEVTLTLVTASGASTTVRFTVPSTLSEKSAVRLSY